MFTGIVQTKALVQSIKIEADLARLVVCLPSLFINNLAIGASVAINGVCLTVISFGMNESGSDEEAFIAFDVIDETLKLSNLGALIEGSNVNVERSLKVGDEIGGHIVSGHVHCNIPLVSKEQSPENCALVFLLPSGANKYVLPKGFIAINGVSLTVGFVEDGKFSVHLIPETLSRTNMGLLEIGDKVNIEFDQQTITIVDTIERMKLSLA